MASKPPPRLNPDGTPMSKTEIRKERKKLLNLWRDQYAESNPCDRCKQMKLCKVVTTELLTYTCKPKTLDRPGKTFRITHNTMEYWLNRSANDIKEDYMAFLDDYCVVCCGDCYFEEFKALDQSRPHKRQRSCTPRISSKPPPRLNPDGTPMSKTEIRKERAKLFNLWRDQYAESKPCDRCKQMKPCKVVTVVPRTYTRKSRTLDRPGETFRVTHDTLEMYWVRRSAKAIEKDYIAFMERSCVVCCGDCYFEEFKALDQSRPRKRQRSLE